MNARPMTPQRALIELGQVILVGAASGACWLLAKSDHWVAFVLVFVLTVSTHTWLERWWRSL